MPQKPIPAPANPIAGAAVAKAATALPDPEKLPPEYLARVIAFIRSRCKTIGRGAAAVGWVDSTDPTRVAPVVFFLNPANPQHNRAVKLTAPKPRYVRGQLVQGTPNLNLGGLWWSERLPVPGLPGREVSLSLGYVMAPTPEELAFYGYTGEPGNTEEVAEETTNNGF
jgi:hypothetical protein